MFCVVCFVLFFANFCWSLPQFRFHPLLFLGMQMAFYRGTKAINTSGWPHFRFQMLDLARAGHSAPRWQWQHGRVSPWHSTEPVTFSWDCHSGWDPILSQEGVDPSWSTSLITFQNVSLSGETSTVPIHPSATEAPCRNGFSSEFQNVLGKPFTHSTCLHQQPEGREARAVVYFFFFFFNWDHNIYPPPVLPSLQTPPHSPRCSLSDSWSLLFINYCYIHTGMYVPKHTHNLSSLFHVTYVFRALRLVLVNNWCARPWLRPFLLLPASLSFP